MRRVVLLAAGTLVLAGCGTSDTDRTEDLREAMRVHYEFESAYDGLGTLTVDGDEAIVDAAREWADPQYGAYLYCSWVENWVRGDIDDPDMDIVVRMGGREILRARGASESCVDAEPLP
jgi:hypothetical protein